MVFLMKYLSREVLMVRFIIIHTIIFKMTISKQHFLFVLICSLIVESQVLSPVTNCLGRCLTCDPLSLSDCQAPSACEWGYYNPIGNGTCLSIPTAKVQVILRRWSVHSWERKRTNHWRQWLQGGVILLGWQYVNIFLPMGQSIWMWLASMKELRCYKKHLK